MFIQNSDIMNHDVFISYSSQDKEAAQAICHTLEQNEIRCWMAPRDIPPGSEYGDLIDEAIKSSTIVVVLFSETAATSLWVKGELNIAFEEQKVIIPFRLDKTPLMGQNRVILNQKHWIDAYPDYKTKFNDLVYAVSQSIGRKVDMKQGNTVIVRKDFKKYILGGVLIAVIIAIIAIFYPLIRISTQRYSYNQNGLHVNVSGISPLQKEALTSMLNKMLLVEGGDFIMGNDYNNIDYFTEQDSLGRNPHSVNLSNFYISKYELTQQEWEAFFPLEGKCIEFGENKAIDMLSWEDAQSFCDTLSSITGLDISLPTEAQWEYAARGGQKSRGYIFSGHTFDIREVAWTSYDELTSSHEVGGKRSNELGLYDMTGNVSEWCKDYYAEYDTAFTINPQGPQTGMYKVIRGGDFRIQNFYDMKVTTRYYASPFVNRKATGLRLVINLKDN